MTWKSKLWTSSLFKSWWVLLIAILSYSVYSHAMQRKEEECVFLKKKFESLVMEKYCVLQEREDLLLQINSQSDPAWIELTLMKELGLVPEGQQKIYFKD